MDTRGAILLAATASLISGCDAPSIARDEGKAQVAEARATIPQWDARQCGDDEYRNARMERHPDLIGRPAEDLLASYGKPHADERFLAGTAYGAYRGGVASQLPGGAQANAQTTVREIVWQRAGCSFIVRFREADGTWCVFDAFEALADADF